jgi:predicted membrane channel-forming protein YqfA (hemolysin III family)
MVTTLFPKLTSPILRVSMYFFFGLSFLDPILFLEYNYNPDIAMLPNWMKLAPIGAVYYVSTILYFAKIPERWLKGQVDYFGSSHNIFHVMILVALTLTMKESWLLYKDRQNFVCPATGQQFEFL